jgi:hypothetical protein
MSFTYVYMQVQPGVYTKLEEVGVGGDDLKGNLFGPKKASKAVHKITNVLVV